ncbi:MAG: dephospho-CoA kinase [Bacteroidales bacterium]
MIHVGLTGGIGSGKSLVGSVLKALGVPVYEADFRSKQLLEQETGLVEGVVDLFGSGAYQDGRLNRFYVAEKAFGDASLLQKLNALVHPRVREDYLSWREEQHGVPYTVEEAAILFESGAARWVDRVLVVTAPEALRIRRVMERDGVDEAAVRSRLRQQWTEEERLAQADDLLNNDEKNMLLPQILSWDATIRDLAAATI